MLLKQASIKQLENELNKRKQAKINELQNEKSIIDKAIKSLSGSVSVTDKSSTSKVKKIVKIRKAMHKHRIHNDKSLKDFLVEIAADGTAHTAVEFVTALENNGWKSSSAKPYYVVAAALASLANQNVFHRVKKGSYVLAKGDNIIPNAATME